MRDALHKLLTLCGAALVCMRFIPVKEGNFVSKLFFENAVHNRIDALCVKVFMATGLTVDQYQTQVSGLMSLAHVSSLFVEAAGIAVTFYIITRWV
jgi:hypothetical protein